MEELMIDNSQRKAPKVLPQLRVTTQPLMRSSVSSSSSSPSSSPSYNKRRKLNNCWWVDDDKGNSQWKKEEEKKKNNTNKGKKNLKRNKAVVQKPQSFIIEGFWVFIIGLESLCTLLYWMRVVSFYYCYCYCYYYFVGGYSHFIPGFAYSQRRGILWESERVANRKGKCIQKSRCNTWDLVV